MPIDTTIDADAGSCRATAQWLDVVGRNAEDTAAGVDAARRRSADGWEGAAGDAFRDRTGRLCDVGDRVAGDARDAARLLSEYAGDVDAAEAAMARARAIAADAGLPVDGELIGEPTSGTDRHRRAFAAAGTLATDARARYLEAQERLRAGLAPSTDLLNSPQFTWAYRGALVPLATASTLHGVADGWKRVGAHHEEQARQWQRALHVGPAAPGASSVNPRARYEEARRLAARADAAAGSNGRLLLGLQDRPVVGRVLEGARSAPLPDGASGLLGRAAPVLRNVPYLSLGTTALGIGVDVAAGRSVGSATAKNVTQTAASIATTAGVLALTGLAVAGGPATLVAIGAGFAVSWAIGDHWDTVEDRVT
ncbi:hypothetical protein GCM10023201_02490 [Actinomycetospora corticicola]|uniref:Uncharacterized protein YukE n=1 Tax=Actinomycetospora corticicola TaxID=663602 RepID=A0A7Y9E2N0_9PSEU|nr:hypothetical protein [Actinomycetospora corticicola]NYD39915.1 uncharacterized protein YukE [Actinomycetospora corticicola]